jgi:mono/diheme cytochrome c family protein
LKNSSLFHPPGLAALQFAAVLAAVLAATTAAQVPQTAPAQQPPAGSPPAEEHNHTHPAPTNLKVLPKTLTGDQVHEIMEGWEAALGAHCNACHTPDPNNIGPNGRPRLNFADDSKPEKSTARLMFRMTEDINKNYVSMVENSGAPVTCGTCHRGHLGPEPWVAPKEAGPRPSQGPPPAGSVTPQPK